MTASEPYPREAVGVFNDANEMQAAIDDLLSTGFDRADISLLAGDRTLDAHPDLSWRSSQELEDEPDTPKTFYVAPESIGDAQGALIAALAYIGGAATAAFTVGAGLPIAGAIAATVLAGTTGGGIGALLGQILRHHHADQLGAELARGGLLLWVHTRDADHEARAVSILRRNHATDVHVHDVVPERLWHGLQTVGQPSA